MACIYASVIAFNDNQTVSFAVATFPNREADWTSICRNLTTHTIAEVLTLLHPLTLPPPSPLAQGHRKASVLFETIQELR